MRIAPHTDYGTLTILRADNAPGGLQVRGPREEWLEVEFPGDVFTVNLGDLMQRWTNDRWRSTLHRVVPPPPPPPGAAAADTRRQSIAYFHNLNRAAVCETFPSCIDDAHPRRYAPVKAFDHLMSRHAAATGGTAPLRSGGEGEEGGEAATS
jgi:isopenicillin N synthase-like dioxygenase